MTKTIITNHGVVKTPFFMPDATRGVVKTLSIEDVKKTGTQAMVVNTFHLYLQPGINIIKKAGGIHKFMNWDGPLLSDSGGFQVFSLIHKNSQMGEITDQGAIFKSPLNGSKHVLTPEKSIQIQFDLGVDMMVVLDDCPPYEFSKEDVEKAVDRTIAWAKRCKIEYEKQIKKRRIKGRKPLLFAVIQGGKCLDLRKKCALGLLKIGFDGYGFGARPVDEKGKFLAKVLKYTADLIPDKYPRFALGIGTPDDIMKCYKMGWDMFDCVIPTREGRHGKLFNFTTPVIARSKATKQSRSSSEKHLKYKTINISNAKFLNNFKPINANSQIKELKEYSLSFLNHLFKTKEPLGARLASLNNLEFYANLMKKI